jgi:hypothetical protein
MHRELEFSAKDPPYTQTFTAETGQHFQLTKELVQCHQDADQAAPPPRLHIKKYCQGKKVNYNRNGCLPDHEPKWTGPHKFTANKGTKQVEIHLQCHHKILIHHANLQPPESRTKMANAPFQNTFSQKPHTLKSESERNRNKSAFKSDKNDIIKKFESDKNRNEKDIMKFKNDPSKRDIIRSELAANGTPI